MRTYDTLTEAISEIRRDLYKAPVVNSDRVQGLTRIDRAHEAMNYGYTILPGGMPTSKEEFMDTVCAEFPFWEENREKLALWLQEEVNERNIGPSVTADADALHPILSTLKEGETYSYFYSDRLIGSIDSLVRSINADLYTRRAFWPIYLPQDGVRSWRPTRIPCSLGYWANVRRVGDRCLLNLTYLQRSCDFDHYWASDIWYAYCYQRALYHHLEFRMVHEVDIELGSLSHFILSLHSFIKKEEY